MNPSGGGIDPHLIGRALANQEVFDLPGDVVGSFPACLGALETRPLFDPAKLFDGRCEGGNLAEFIVQDLFAHF